LVADLPTQTPTEKPKARVYVNFGEIERILNKAKGRFVDLERLFKYIKKSVLPEECDIVHERNYLEEQGLDVSASLISEDYKVGILTWTVDGEVICVKGEETVNVGRITLYTYGIDVINKKTDTAVDSADIIIRYTITRGEGGG